VLDHHSIGNPNAKHPSLAHLNPKAWPGIAIWSMKLPTFAPAAWCSSSSITFHKPSAPPAGAVTAR